MGVINELANMTNKEAADLIRSIIANTIVCRGSGKSIMALKMDIALNKAIELLEKTPD